MVFIIVVLSYSFLCHYAERQYAECPYAECCYAEYYYAECCCVVILPNAPMLNSIMLRILIF